MRVRYLHTLLCHSASLLSVPKDNQVTPELLTCNRHLKEHTDSIRIIALTICRNVIGVLYFPCFYLFFRGKYQLLNCLSWRISMSDPQEVHQIIAIKWSNIPVHGTVFFPLLMFCFYSQRRTPRWAKGSGLGAPPDVRILSLKLAGCWGWNYDFQHFKRDEALFINVTEGFVTSGTTKQE